MDFCITTSRGGKVSVHFGKITTTNLFKSEWRIITDAKVINDLRTVADTPEALNALQAKYNATIDSVSIPYTRDAMKVATGPAPSAIKPTATGGASEVSSKPSVSSEDIKILVAKRKDAAEKLQNFFSEFSFKPGCRFLNTLSKQTSTAASRRFVNGYMALCNQPDQNDIAEKVKSAEFEMLAKEITELASDNIVNKRVRLYFGDPGTGKTTRAIKENPGAKVFICNSSMTGDDLLQVFDFNDENGHPVFKKSIIREAMESGAPIILDEINLLSLDALRTLQEITDDKDCVNFHGDNIEIKPGFKIIGTMNLMICGQPFGLPEALVDRAEYIEEFTLTASALASYGF